MGTVLKMRLKTSAAKILVVDDEPAIIELVSAYLRKEGYQVFTAQDGPSGLKGAHSVRPDSPPRPRPLR